MQRFRHPGRARIARCGLVAMLAFTLAGCTSFFSGQGARSGVSSSVVDYLYPPGTEFTPATEGTPEIRLPARVGLMFVPSSNMAAPQTAADRQMLLEQVRDAFKAQPFIERIEIVPDAYLRPRGGFDNLEQVARMMGLDVVALVSYDQVGTSGDRAASFLYWTIVGAYTIPATRNQVSTFVETTVFDVRSRTLLLRAPGQDQRDADSTAIGSDGARDRLARAGFQASMQRMTVNLDVAIDDFGRRVREEKQVALVDRRSGREWSGRSGGGGSMGAWDLGLLLAALGLLLLRRRG